MNRILALLFVLASTAAASAQALYVPHSPGGVAATSTGMLKDFLNTKGYNIELKNLGSCALVKQTWQESQDKVLTIWEDSFNSKKNEVCNLPVDNTQLVEPIYQTFYYFCALPGKDQTSWNTKASTYTLGHTQGLPVNTLFNSLNQQVGSNAKLVPYRNSGALSTAIAAKEIDYALVSGGMSKIIQDGGKCFWSTAPEGLSALDIPNVKSLNQTNPVSEVGVSLWIMSKNFSNAEVKKLSADIEEFLKSDQWNKYIASRENKNVLNISKQKRQDIMNYNKNILDQYQ